MVTESVFIFDSGKKNRLDAELFKLGIISIKRENQFEALDLIKHNNFPVILINSNNLQDDIIEFVLNVRDFRSKTPILIIGNSITLKERNVFRSMKNIFFNNSNESISETLKKLLNKKNV